MASLQRSRHRVLAQLVALLNKLLRYRLLRGLAELLKLGLSRPPEVEELEEHGAALLGVEFVVEEAEAVADEGVGPVLGGVAVGEAVPLGGIVHCSGMRGLVTSATFVAYVRLGVLSGHCLGALGRGGIRLGAFGDCTLALIITILYIC